MAAWSLAGRGRLDGEDRGGSTGNTSTWRRSWSAAVQRGSGSGGEARRTGAPRRRTAGRRADRRRAGPRARDRAGHLRPRLRAHRRAPAWAPDRRQAVAHPGRSHRARHRCARTTDPVSRQRPPRGHAGQRGGDICRALRVLPARSFALATTNDSGYASASVLQAAGAELVKVIDLRRGERVDGAEAELLLVSGGWNPNLALWSQAGGASGSTTGSAHTSPMASCGTSRSSGRRPANGCRTAPPRRWTAPATRTPRSSTSNGTPP